MRMQQREHCIMKRDSNGITYSGIHSTTRLEDWCLFVHGMFLIEGYYETSNEREMLEMLFIEYTRNGRAIRRVFHRCTFSFIGFTLSQIQQTMAHLISPKPNGIEFAFFGCQVLLDGKKVSYVFPTPSYRVPLEIWSIQGAVHTGVYARYNLQEAHIEVKGETKEFSDLYRWKILTRRHSLPMSYSDFQAAMTLSSFKQVEETQEVVPPYQIVIEDIEV